MEKRLILENSLQRKDTLREFKKLLSNPELLISHAQEITLQVKERGAQFPTAKTYAAAVATPGQFLKESQASDASSHNIGHLFATAVLYGTMAEDVNNQHTRKNDGSPLQLNVKDGIEAGGTHDSRRWFNHFETFFPGAIYFHGRRAATYFEKRLSPAAKSIVAHHDDVWPLGISSKINTPEFQLFRVADRLGLVRFMLKGWDNPLKDLILHKLLSKNPEEKALFLLKDNYTIVAAALYYLGVKYSAEIKSRYEKKNATDIQDIQYAIRPKYDYQFDGFMKAAQELGMIGEE